MTKKEKKIKNWEKEFEKEFIWPNKKGEICQLYKDNPREFVKKLKSFIRQLLNQAYQEGFEAGQHEATSQYKRDMEDAYEKGRRDVKEEMKEKFKKYNRLLKEIDKL